MIEHIGQLDWCNGNVALAGNSWLGIAQWFIAATRPPHLKCIAPLEGASDLYREILCRGGIPQPTFWDFLSDTQRGMSSPIPLLPSIGLSEDLQVEIDRKMWWECSRSIL